MVAAVSRAATPTSPTLAGTDAPTVGLILKWIAIVLGLAALTVVVVGLLLPREWEVEHSVEITGDVAEIHALVSDAERWDTWMFDSSDPSNAAGSEPADRGQGVGG
jgi:hypothetical protein